MDQKSTISNNILLITITTLVIILFLIIFILLYFYPSIFVLKNTPMQELAINQDISTTNLNLTDSNNTNQTNFSQSMSTVEWRLATNQETISFIWFKYPDSWHVFSDFDTRKIYINPGPIENTPRGGRSFSVITLHDYDKEDPLQKLNEYIESTRNKYGNNIQESNFTVGSTTVYRFGGKESDFGGDFPILEYYALFKDSTNNINRTHVIKAELTTNRVDENTEYYKEILDEIVRSMKNEHY